MPVRVLHMTQISAKRFRRCGSLGAALASSVLAYAPLCAAESQATAPTEQYAAAQNTNASLVQADASRPDADRFAIFKPAKNSVRHTIDYEIWDFALKQLVISMGPSLRKRPLVLDGGLGSRIRAGHNSLYRTEGSMMFFSLLSQDAITSFGEYRQDLERVASMLDIATLPRNEQLAFWLNMHNVTMVEYIAKEWPVRQPRQITIDGVPLDDAKVLTIRGIAMSLRDIRENIVYPNWRNPKVIYGFWRGELGGPALDRDAYTGKTVSSLLDWQAQEYVNSLRGTQKRGKTLHVSTLYDDVRDFYFPDFQTDLRAHIVEYASEDVLDLANRTEEIEPSIREWDIADLSGGRRDSIALVNSRPGLSQGAQEILEQRRRKFLRMRRDKVPTGRVFFSDLVLPGDDPNKGQVE